MTEISEVKMKKCKHCPYKTASETSIRRHILERKCPAGSNSYTEGE